MNNASNKTIFAGIFGSVLESYDFAIYAFLSPILATLFFPNKDPIISLLLTLSVFALSFFIRPLGGILFGYLGDHYGRKNALIISIIIMSVPTFLLGLLPTFSTIGIWAPILLTLLRLTQGIAVSGELTTAISYLVEHANTKHRGFFGSFVMCSGFGGTALSCALVALLTLFMTHEQLLNWGWRLPFLFGGIIGFVGLFLRLKSHETLHYQMAKKNSEKNIQRRSILKHYKNLPYKPILIAILLTCVMAISNYFIIAYFNIFLIKTMERSSQTIMLINFICLLSLTILLPLLGILSDKFGRKPILMSGIISLILFAHPIFWLLQQQEIFLIFIGQFIFILILAPIAATVPTVLAEMFQVHTRNSSVSLSYNISLALFGGTAPLIALELTARTESLFSPAWYILAGACISLLTLLNIKESYRRPLE